MTSNPYTPDEIELRDCYVQHMSDYAGEDDDRAKADAERGIAKIKADALRSAAKELRAMSELDSPYLNGAGFVADDWGNSADSIDTWYADWVEEQADRIEEEA